MNQGAAYSYCFPPPPAPLRFNYTVFPSLVYGAGRQVMNLAPRMHGSVGQDRATTEEHDCFLSWVLRQAGVDPAQYRFETLRRRWPAVLRALRVSSLADARVAVHRDPGLIPLATDAMIIGVTSFFRDPDAFNALSQRVVPSIGRMGASARILSVGCADGSELYSVAILLAEQGVLHRCQFEGLDCRAAAVRAAREGIYQEDALTAVPAQWKQRYFRRADGNFRIVDWMRGPISWRLGDALSALEPGEWDLILCRNLSIYLRPPAAERLCFRLRRALRPGGVLMLGNAERPGAGVMQQIGPCLFQRSEDE
jgi:chemotaxis methyl-accepting protein methylase